MLRASSVLPQTRPAGQRNGDSVPDRLRSIARQVDRLSRLYGGDPEALFAEKEDAVRELRRLAAAIERRAA